MSDILICENDQRLKENARELEQALALVRKAVHLLYFIVKHHPFVDGSKRSAAFLVVDFLHRNGRLFNAHPPDYESVGG